MRLREAGLCHYCGKEALEPGQKRCTKCTDRYKAAVNEAKRQGLCRSCLTRPRRQGRVQCAICLKTQRRSEHLSYRVKVKFEAVLIFLKSLVLATTITHDDESRPVIRLHPVSRIIHHHQYSLPPSLGLRELLNA